jgi:hypothetical protein
MEIHRPRPWRGWREFLKEYGIIVLGVLTALALEQVVDALRWAHEIGDARQALGREITYNIKALKLIGVQDACMGQRLDALRLWAEGSGPRPPEAVRRPIYYTFETSAWDVANSGQVVAHFPLDQKLRFARAYASFDNERNVIAEERDAWQTIAAIASEPNLDDGDRRELRHAIGLARTIGPRRRGNAVIILRESPRLAVDGPGPPLANGPIANPAAFCRAIATAPGRRGLSTLGSPS